MSRNGEIIPNRPTSKLGAAQEGTDVNPDEYLLQVADRLDDCEPSAEVSDGIRSYLRSRRIDAVHHWHVFGYVTSPQDDGEPHDFYSSMADGPVNEVLKRAAEDLSSGGDYQSVELADAFERDYAEDGTLLRARIDVALRSWEAYWQEAPGITGTLVAEYHSITPATASTVTTELSR